MFTDELIFQLPGISLLEHAWCTEQRQSTAKADLKQLGQITRTLWGCSSPPLTFPSSLKFFQHRVCWRMDTASMHSCHKSWKDFLAHALCKATSDSSEIFRNLSTAFRGQNFALCKATAWNSVRCEGSYKIELKSAVQGRLLFTE